MADTIVKSTEGKKKDEPSTSAPPSDKPGQRRRRGTGKKKPEYPKVDGDPFAPRHLAAPGPVVNDPLSDKCFFPFPGEDLATTSGTKKIFPGCEGLVPLATEEYTGLVAHTFSVKRSISLSGYCYYAACLTWARLLGVDAKNGGVLNYGERQFIDMLEKYKPPKILASYLAGFGNTDHPNGFHQLVARLKKPQYVRTSASPYFEGYFGKLKDNARYYAAYPCIAIFAQRIMEDLRATYMNDDDIEWDLPADMSYPGHGLTDSCIGYAPAQPIDRAIINTYQLCGVTRNNFEVEGSTPFAVNFSLLNEIQLWTDEVRNVVQLPVPSSVAGSRGQLLLEKIVNPRNTIKNSTWQSFGALRIQVGVGYAGSTFLYRVVKRYEGTGSQSLNTLFCPFMTNAYIQVPPDLNFLRTAEDDALLAVEDGVSPEYILGQRLRMFIGANLSEKTNKP